MKDYDYEYNSKLKHHQAPAYLDTETGEFTEIDRGQGNTISINYKHYFMMDVDTLNELVKSKLLSRVEKGYITDMAAMLKTSYNALYNKQNNPHTIDSLSVDMELSYDRMTKLLKQLVKKGVLGRLTVGEATYHVMNPFLARRRQYVDKDVCKMFPNFKEPTDTNVSKKSYFEEKTDENVS